MKRKALLIGSPLTEGLPGYLRGVYKDIQNMIDYLQSSIGGGWLESELTWLINPTENDVKNHLDEISSETDLAIVYYSGHGFMLSGNDYIKINKQEVFQVRKLITTAKRQLIFIDSCRVDCGLLGYGDPLGIGTEFDRSDSQVARDFFDQHISNAPLGGVITFSSLPNQVSTDFDQGGVYTVNLFRSLLRWYESNSSDVLTIGNAFIASTITLHGQNIEQIPEQLYIANKKAFDIPFAINPKKGNKNIPSQSMAGQRIGT